MKWKRKGGKYRAQAAGCQFVVTKTPEWWDARYCDRSGTWSDTTIWDEKAEAVKWCELQAQAEAIRQNIEDIENSNRQREVKIRENFPSELKPHLKIYRIWKTAPVAEQEEVLELYPNLRGIMKAFVRIEEENNVSL